MAAFLVASNGASLQAVGAFADSAQKALAAGPPLFNDLNDSCVRRETARPSQIVLPLFLPPGSKNAPAGNPPQLQACVRFAAEAQALNKVSDILTAYFRAMQQLSSFNNSAVTTANESAAESAAMAAGLSAVEIDSVSKLASIVTELFTAHYQRRHLFEDLRQADPAVTNITKGLETAINNYQVFLNEEQQTVAARYQSVADPNEQPATTLLLNRAYSADVAQIKSRHSAAAAYLEVLKNIREGDRKLVESANHLSTKELTAALQPYTSKLDGLVLTFQKSN